MFLHCQSPANYLRNGSEPDEAKRALAADGWIDLKPVQYRPHLLARIQIPLAVEERWRNSKWLRLHGF
jgi:hypothetical protein